MCKRSDGRYRSGSQDHYHQGRPRPRPLLLAQPKSQRPTHFLKPSALVSPATHLNSARPNREWLLGLFLLGLVPRLVILAARPWGLEFWEYETLATNIVAGQGYVISHFGNLTFAFGDGNLY